MIEVLRKTVENKRILILGFGREGRATLKAIKDLGAKEIVIADAKSFTREETNGIPGIYGDNYQDCIDDFDVCFKSPGIVLEKPISEYKALITSETEVFMQAYRDRVIGITGTKGKSTTASLLYHVLSMMDLPVLFGGNIGIPLFELNDKMTKDSIVVAELSCHQLEFLKTSPKTALLLNISEDHLDHYKTRENYANAKRHIYRAQKPKDLLITTRETLDKENVVADTYFAEDVKLPFASFEELSHVSLRGDHNLSNCRFVYLVAKQFGISDDLFIRAVETFQTLPHRLEPIGNFEGIDYYDDSISTTVASTINAVLSIKNAAFLLLGGMERNIVYDELIAFLPTSGLKEIVCMYESGKRIYNEYLAYIKANEIRNAPTAVFCDDLEGAVKHVKETHAKAGACILSPASASYGYFKNFEERGDRFKFLIFEKRE